MAEAYRRDIMTPEQRTAYEEAMRRGLVTGPERSAGQRFLDNLKDGWARSGIGSVMRSADPEADGLLSLGDLTRVRPNSPLDWVLDRTAGRNRTWMTADEKVPDLGQVLTGQGLRGREAAAVEDRRRDSYAARAAADPIENPLEFGAFLAGQATGGGVSPENWIGGGTGRVGTTLATRLATRVGEQALIAGSTDVALQLTDIGSGIEDSYSPGQTLGAAALGGVFSLGGTGVSAVVERVRPTSPIVRSAFTDPVVARAATPDVEPSPRGLIDTVRDVFAARPEPKVDVEPDFAIVQPVARDTPLRDALARVREGELPQMIGDWMARRYTDVVAEQHPLVRMVERVRSQTEAVTGKPIDIAPGDDPRMLARGRYDWTSIGHQDLLHGVHGYRELTPSTPALADVVSAVAVRAKRAGEAPEAAIQRFNEYMVARRASAEWDRHARGELKDAPVAKSKAEADGFIEHIDKADPEFRKLSDAVNEFAAGQLKKDLDAGFITRATYSAAMKNRNFYVPLRRVMDDAKPSARASGKNKGKAVQRFEGSQRDVVDPISVLIQRAYRQAQRVRQNEVNLALVKMAETLERVRAAAGDVDPSNGWIRKIDVSKKVTVDATEVGKAAARRGKTKAERDAIAADVEDLLDGEGVDVWRPGEINDAGRPILYVWRGGKREAWEVIDEEWGRDVFEAVGGMSKPMSDMFTNLVAVPTTVLSQAITRDPSFMLANFVRDQVSSWISSDVGFIPGEGALGVRDELRQADITRLYGVAGGISGGAQTASLGDVFAKADTLALAKRGVRAKYFSSLGGLLATSEITETGTRVQVFKRAFERARVAGHTDYDSLIQASFTARDIMDFGRTGSKVHTVRRLVTFLNAYAQGLDKTLRTITADGGVGGRVALRDAIRPLFGMKVEPGTMRAEDAAALKLAGRAWTKMAALATFGLALTALNHDDPDYQQANERTRATHWVIPWGDNLVRVPKPFEQAFLSNIVERGFEATIGKDDKAWGRMWRGLAEIFAPPTDVPLLAVAGGVASNTNNVTGRPIVPEHLQELPPSQQYQHWNSQFSRWLGGVVDVSPAMIDYVIQGFGGPIGSYALGGMDAADPERPSGAWTDLPVVRRFVSPAARGSQDKRDFYDRAGGRNSRLQRALNGINEYRKQGQVKAAEAIFADLDEVGRIYVASQMGSSATDRLNPLHRAKVVGQEASRLIGELNGAQPKDDGQALPDLNRRERQSVEEAIERITVAEMRNAMIITRQPGFENRSLEDRDGLWQDLRDIAPAVEEELQRRLGIGSDRAYDYTALVELWPEVESRLRSEGSTAYLDDLASDAEGRTMSWGDKGRDVEDEPPISLRP